MHKAVAVSHAVFLSRTHTNRLKEMLVAHRHWGVGTGNGTGGGADEEGEDGWGGGGGRSRLWHHSKFYSCVVLSVSMHAPTQQHELII